MIASLKIASEPMETNVPEIRPGERISCNLRWDTIQPVLSVLVPTFQDAGGRLFEALSACERSLDIEVIIYDDGSADQSMTQQLIAAIKNFPGAACLITAEQNYGRAFGRNRLKALARSNWLLFLDADMVPDNPNFLSRYLTEIEPLTSPAMIVGGFSLKHAERTKQTELHWAQSETSECLSADSRNQTPGRYVFTSNVLCHRDIMDSVAFDPAFSGWGWEDVDWGLRVASRFPVRHIDNTATHTGLDNPETLIRKYTTSGKNFWRLADLHKAAMADTPLFKMASLFSKLPGKTLIQKACEQIARAPGWIMPVKLRLLALKLLRAAAYGKARQNVI